MDFKGKDKEFIDEWIRMMLPNLDLSAYERLGYLKGYSRYKGKLDGCFQEQYEQLIDILTKK